ncbi:MAG TPA: hypothetical protein ENK04_09865 [Gammaproteobacteria bacterium]|nr:hypothetical protein [Gammaproteobacteria bacterium]
MKRSTQLGILASGLALALWVGGAAAHGGGKGGSTAPGVKKNSTRISIKASNPVRIRRVTGPVDDANRILGVPTEPVDSFDWGGQALTPIKGHARLEIDPIANTGRIRAEWEDEYGRWTYRQDTFGTPPHGTGIRIGASRDTVTEIVGDPITTNVYLHGDTGIGGPVTPTFFAQVAIWGPAKITLNGQRFDNPFPDRSGSLPFMTPKGSLWGGHILLSEEFRGDDGVVRTTSGEVFNPSLASEGLVYPDKINLNLSFLDIPNGEMNGNMPPTHRFFYYISFKKVKVTYKYK